MTKYRWDCEKQGCRVKQRWDPGCLDGLLPRGGSVGDMDGWAEVGGEFLFIEEKNWRGCLETGQRLALERLAQLPHCTVWYIKERADGGYLFWDMAAYEPTEATTMTHNAFCALVRMWGEKADHKETP